MRSETLDYVVIASPASEHHKDLTELSRIHFSGLILIEKPLFHKPVDVVELQTKNVAVGYNLRFHALTSCLRSALHGLCRVDEAQFHVGQLLTDWRPGRNYRDTSSARRSTGGGVLRDLSHELDLARHLLGNIIDFSVESSCSNQLDIDGPDEVRISAKTELCDKVSITLNYLDQPAQRRVRLKYKGTVTSADFISSMFITSDNHQNFDVSVDDSYRKMHHALISRNFELGATLDDGLYIVQWINDIEERLADRTL